ncbi:MAG: hypothetical protein GX182_06190 [Firmicutes bacterium]|jgi:hypothetical protein|nr:hypothetical protein [Bacillota bacterium]
MKRLPMELVEPFFAALGVVLGGALIGSLATLFNKGSPLATMLLLARNMKMWGILVAIGGTMPTLRIIESGLFDGQLGLLLRQMVVILGSFAGANVAYWLVVTIAGVK